MWSLTKLTMFGKQKQFRDDGNQFDLRKDAMEV